jgi:hypothetical protein
MFIDSIENELFEVSSMAQDQKFSRVMTVAQIREHEGNEPDEILFLESARFYKLPKESSARDALLSTLRQARAAGRTVEVTLLSIESDVIEDVKPAD